MLLLFILLAVNLVEGAPLLNGEPPIPQPGLYVMAFQWGISLCRDHQTGFLCRQPVLPKFTLYYFARHLYDCTAGRDLLTSDVDGIEGMNEEWPSHLVGVTNFEFWRRQWRKHGRCLGLTPEQYFKNVLRLKKQIDDEIGESLIQFFINKRLPPSETKRYDPRRFLGEILSKMGVITQMQCNINNKFVYQLLEIKFCFNNNWKLRNCLSHDRPKQYSKNKLYLAAKRKGLNSQRKPPPPPPPRLPSFHTGLCYGNGPILFPTQIAPPPPPPPSRRRKSPPLKRKQRAPPPPPPSPRPSRPRKSLKRTPPPRLRKSPPTSPPKPLKAPLLTTFPPNPRYKSTLASLHPLFTSSLYHSYMKSTVKGNYHLMRLPFANRGWQRLLKAKYISLHQPLLVQFVVALVVLLIGVLTIKPQYYHHIYYRLIRSLPLVYPT